MGGFSSLACFLLLPPFCYGANDSIIAGQSINETQTITSAGGKFQLRFSTLSSRNNSERYIVMWCQKDFTKAAIWVANSENPITDSSGGVLKIGDDGNLVIVDAGGANLWSTNVTSLGGTETTEAVLLDSGNLILRRDGEILWQSFDHPTDTLLPGMKLGFSLKTNKNWSLTSGNFMLSMDSQGQIFAMQNGIRNWRGGYWNGSNFNGLPEMRRNMNIHNYSFVSNKNETYFSYNSSLISRLVIESTGRIEQYALEENGESGFWNPSWSRANSRCQDYGVCGSFGVSSCKDDALTTSCSCLQGLELLNPNNSNGGCGSKSLLDCGKDFVPLERMKLPDGAVQRRSGESLQDCEAECRSNCSCVAYALVNSKCMAWGGNLTDLHQYDSNGGGDVFYLRVAASEHGESLYFITVKDSNPATVFR